MLSHLKWLTVLSLDAPLVAVAWQALFAKGSAAGQGWHHFLIVFLSVWLGYAADRWLDARKVESGMGELHRFYVQNRSSVFVLWLLVLIGAIALALATLKVSEIASGLALTCASIAYTLFAQKARSLRFYPLAKCVGTSLLILAASLIFQNPAEFRWLAVSPVGLLFLTNCVLIRSWNQAAGKRYTVAAGANGLASLVASLFAITNGSQSIGVACCLSLILLLSVQLTCVEQKREIRRTLADLCLLTPLPILFL